MTFRTSTLGGFELVRVSSLRAAQLMQGSTPRVPAFHKWTSTALREVTEGKVEALPRPGVDGAGGVP